MRVFRFLSIPFLVVFLGCSHTLNVTTQGLGSVRLDPPGDTYDCSTTLTVTAIPNPGWRFDGWSGDVSGANNPIVLMMDSDKRLTATFLQE